MMPQDPDLYGRRPKKQKTNPALPSSLDFTTQLTSLMSAGSRPPSTRSRASKEPKNDLFKKAKPQPKEKDDKLNLKDVHGTEDEARERARTQRRMEEKARTYAAMKRGDYVPRDNEAEPLVDFDRKWAQEEEGKGGYSSLEDSDDEEAAAGSSEIVEWEDEFGRVRTGTRAERDKHQRDLQRGFRATQDLETMSARPSAPQKVIYGDAIQSMAFTPSDPTSMEELASKRDRSVTPPPNTHYDADWEVRTKGTGFYKFSKDEGDREREMKELKEERDKTEDVRKQREEEMDKRRKAVEERRKEMEERRAKKQADKFLNGM